MNPKDDVQTVSRILNNRKNVIREGVDIYKCTTCEGTVPAPKSLYCKDKMCRGTLIFYKRIPQSRVEEITSRRAARQCPSCMKIYKMYVEKCPLCSGHPGLIKGKVVRDKDKLAKMYEYQYTK